MRKFVLLFFLSAFYLLSSALSFSAHVSVSDLEEQVRWIKIDAVELAVKDMAKDPSFDKKTVQEKLEELKQLVREGFAFLETDNSARERAVRALDLHHEIMLSNPLLKDAMLVASRYVLKDNARKVMAPKLGTQSNNWTNQQSNAYRGYDASIVCLDNLQDSVSVKTIYKPSGTAVIADLRLHWDGKRLIFTSVTEDDRLNVFGVNADGSDCRPLINTTEPDLEFYDGIYLPDGRIIAVSNIGYQAVPCIHGDGPVGNMVLYDPESEKLRRLTFDQDANWNPVVNHTGMVMYTRWEYTDLMHYYSRFVMRMNPDGTEQKAVYGSGEMFPNSTFDIQPLPGHSSAFVGIISGHHGVARSGRLILFNPLQNSKGAAGMMQEIPYRNRPVETVEKDRLVDGVWPQFIKPMPLNDRYFLVTAKLSPNSLWGIYLVDVYDNITCLYQAEGEGYISPILLKSRPTPPVIPDRVNLSEKEATVFIQDVYEGEGLRGVPRGVVKSLRVHAYEYAYNRSASNHEAMGIQSGWDIKRNLGTVPIEEDGSVMFKIPANTPVSIQPLDKDGRAIQWMRSWLTGMPGEVVSCIGCHEDSKTIVIPKRVMASEKQPLRLTPPDGGVRPFTFDLEVQPVLDRACISCHNESHRIDLRGGKKTDRGFKKIYPKPVGFVRYGIPEFSTSYMALHPYVHRQGSEADMKVLQPYEYHASTSELIRMLEAGHQGVKLTDKEWLALTQWIDYNVPDVGVFQNIRPYKGVEQYERRIALADKYACGQSVDWKKELADYSLYLKNKQAGSVNKLEKASSKQKKNRVKKVKGWPFDSEKAQSLQGSLQDRIREYEIAPGVSVRFVHIPAGSFLMGDNEASAVPAKVEKSFWMGEIEVTNALYNVFVPEHDSRYVDQLWKDHVNAGYPANQPDQPVIRVSLEDALRFCKLLGEKIGCNVTLPTEEQWEWACRAGNGNAFWYGGLEAAFSSYENLADVSLEKMAVKGVDPQPMKKSDPYFESYNFIPKIDAVNDCSMLQGKGKQYQPNAFGLYDMHGNVAEWTVSKYAQDQDERCVVRGGSYIERPKHATSYTRKPFYPWQRVFNVGFRLVINE